MASKLTIILGVVIAASVIANVYLYQRSAALDGIVAQLRQENGLLAGRTSNQTAQEITSTPPADTPSLPLSNVTGAPLLSANVTSQSITAVAVSAVPESDGFFQTVRYEGTVMDIAVDIHDGGRGLVLVDTEVPTGVDFQTSAKTAVKVAQSLTGVQLGNKDVIFSIKSKGYNSTAADLQAVDGPSAGAAMTVLLATELRSPNSELNQTVVMTGIIEQDGTIGKVGGVPEKALAAGQYGAKLFLVPAGQATYSEQACDERQEGPFVYRTCKSQEKPLSAYTEEKFGMQVIEVPDIKSALEYFK